MRGINARYTRTHTHTPLHTHTLTPGMKETIYIFIQNKFHLKIKLSQRLLMTSTRTTWPVSQNLGTVTNKVLRSPCGTFLHENRSWLPRNDRIMEYRNRTPSRPPTGKVERRRVRHNQRIDDAIVGVGGDGVWRRGGDMAPLDRGLQSIEGVTEVGIPE